MKTNDVTIKEKNLKLKRESHTNKNKARTITTLVTTKKRQQMIATEIIKLKTISIIFLLIFYTP